jgi:hypothetical protein
VAALAQDSVVVFIDMLGFADVTRRMFRVAPRRAKPSRSTPRPSPYDVYKAFHTLIRISIRTAQRNRVTPSPITAAIFSDSVFVVFDDVDAAVAYARDAMRAALERPIPVRIGIGAGAVLRFNFTVEAFPTSDVILNAPFMGTGIVHACLAERSGKGLRIFVHPSASRLLSGDDLNLLPLPLKEAGKDAVHEVNYARNAIKLADGSLIADHPKVKQIDVLAKQAPRQARMHYSKTLAAITRMNSVRLLQARNRN